MNRSFPARRIALAGLLALAVGLVAGGCAKKVTTPDASRSKLEGQRHPDARMILWQETPSYYWAISDTLANGDPDPNGYHVEHPIELKRPTPDAFHVQILDRSNASRYEIYTRNANGALSPLFDYSLAPRVKWLDTNWELYSFTATPGAGNTGAAYLARGIVGGIVGNTSPLTNLAPVGSLDVRQTLEFVSPRIQRDSSAVQIEWTSDSRAAAYWLELLPFDDVDTLITTYGQYNEALPAIEPPGGRRSMHVYVPAPLAPAPTVSAALSSSARSSLVASGSEVISSKRFDFYMHKAYIIRVCAVDADGRVINRLKTDFRRVPNEGESYYPVGGCVFAIFTRVDEQDPNTPKFGFLRSGEMLIPWSEIYP